VFQTFNAPVYAGFWIRFLAYLIDTVIMIAIFCPLGAIFGVLVLVAGADENSAPMAVGNILINIVSVVAGWLYFSLLESSSWQGTIGKKLLRLTVTDLDGNRIGFGKATGRYFGKLLSSLILGIGFIMAAFTERKQGLHDMLAATLVVKGPATGPAYIPPPPPPDFGSSGGTFSGR
jgi:uncharacterized RDD family membrane protein YckC